MNELSGKTVLITGATNGIGRAAATGLTKLGASLVVVGRSPAKTDVTVQELRALGLGPVEGLVADLSSIAEVRRLADEFRRQHDRLDVLVNNAGAIFASRQLSADGYEMTFALNHLSYFLLTNLLLDRLIASAPARIVNVASRAHESAKLDFADLQGEKSYGMGGNRAYGQSKLANVMFTYALARRLARTGVTANSLHPGVVATGFGENNGGAIGAAMRVFHSFSISPEEGADTVVFLASSPEVAGVSGKYFTKRQPVASSPASYDEAAQKRLWEISAQMTGLEVRDSPVKI
jgi:NAD(P)-dependent dehydrogenase (short-subunit alcohol dehydrogenase family)